jgi:hypothetical protein
MTGKLLRRLWYFNFNPKDILEPFYIATKEMSKSLYPTLAQMVPYFDGILDHLQSASLEFAAQPTIEDAEDICVGISASFSKLMKYFEISSVLAVLATVLDCRYKMEYYNKDGKVSNV